MRALKMLAAALLLQVAASASAQLLVGITNHNWRYFATTGADPGAGWQNVGFDDSSWTNGRGLFGNDTGYPYPFASTFAGPSAGGPNVAFFRTTFNWAGTTDGVILTMTNYFDDGVVIYLNGAEITRFNMNEGPADFTTLAPGTLGEPVVRIHQVNLGALTNLNPNPLVPGNNVLAASVHNNAASSSDTVFGLSVLASQIVAPCPQGPADLTVVQCRNATFTTTETCAIPAATIQWYRSVGAGDEAIAGQTGSSLTVSNVSSADAGEYYAMFSNAGGAVPSRRAQLTVTPDDQAPRIVSVVFTGGVANEALLTFDEPVQPDTVQNTFDYLILSEDSVHQLVVNNAVRDANNFALVRLELSEPPQLGRSYTLSIGGESPVVDVCANNESGLLTATLLQRAILLDWQDGRQWRYNQSGADQGTAWRTPGFDASSWAEGPQGFGNETGGFPDAPTSQRTQLTVSAAQATYYFRTTFTVPSGAQDIRFYGRFDDGAAIYVNGTEIGRVNIDPATILSFDLFTPNFTGDPEGTGYSPAGGILISNSLLVAGNNLLAIEVHQVNATSSDVLMLAKIEGAVGVVVIEPPVVNPEPVSTSVTEGHSFRLVAGASGTTPKFQWFKDNVAIPDATNSTYTAVATASSGGSYRVEASNSAGTDSSVAVTVTVRPVVQPYTAAWKYSIDSQDGTLGGGTPWYAVNFDDAAWSSGPGLFGAETSGTGFNRLPAPIGTILPAPSGTFITAYYRTKVTVPALSAGQTLVLTHYVDDGAAFYIDGALAFRYNLTNDLPILSAALAPAAVPGDSEANLISVPVTLSPGEHTIAVEVHQNSTTSSDTVFGAELRVITGTAPALTITHPSATTIQLTWPANPFYSLFQAGTVNGPYTHILANPQGSLTVPNATNAATFYRLGFNGQ